MKKARFIPPKQRVRPPGPWAYVCLGRTLFRKVLSMAPRTSIEAVLPSSTRIQRKFSVLSYMGLKSGLDQI